MYQNKQDTEQLLTGHFLGLKFAEGWWFTHILETEFVELKPWILLNENGNRAEIAAATEGSEDDEVQDTLDRHFMMPDSSEENLIFQVLYGIHPSRIQVYPIYGRDRSPNLKGTAEPGSPQVPITGFDSPYNDPSDQSQFFTIKDQEIPSLQAYNPMDEPSEARVSFHVNKMKYATVTDKGLMKAMLQGQARAKLHQMGLGAQKRDQVSIPRWLSDTFGQHIYTTQEILNASEEGSASSSQNAIDSIMQGGGS